jgi:hypothetical protein
MTGTWVIRNHVLGDVRPIAPINRSLFEIPELLPRTVHLRLIVLELRSRFLAAGLLSFCTRTAVLEY